VNAGKHKILLQILLVLLTLQTSVGGPAQVATHRGNRLYEQGNFAEAVKQYDQALVDSPKAAEPKFDKANSYYRLDDLEQAMNLYKDVAAEGKSMKLAAKAKYNLGNCSFQQGAKQKDSNPKKAIEDMKSAIGYWRGVLDIEPKNEKAAKNIEVTRLTIKDLLDQLKNQQKQKDPNQPQDPNQPKDPNQQQQSQSQQQSQQQQQNQNQQQSSQQSDKQSQDEQQQQQQGSKEDPNKLQEPNQSQQPIADTTAEEILDKEQRDKKQRQLLQQKVRYGEIDKDW
jgi:Ca-activated chloride channel homolog